MKSPPYVIIHIFQDDKNVTHSIQTIIYDIYSKMKKKNNLIQIQNTSLDKPSSLAKGYDQPPPPDRNPWLAKMWTSTSETCSGVKLV